VKRVMTVRGMSPTVSSATPPLSAVSLLHTNRAAVRHVQLRTDGVYPGRHTRDVYPGVYTHHDTREHYTHHDTREYYTHHGRLAVYIPTMFSS